jgi:hypothetical protein
MSLSYMAIYKPPVKIELLEIEYYFMVEGLSAATDTGKIAARSLSYIFL